MHKILIPLTVLCFLITSVIGISPACAYQGMVLPVPGARIGLSPEFSPSQLKGITIHPENPLHFDFIIHRGDRFLSQTQKKEEYKRLIKYFFASLTLPDKDVWVTY